MPRRVGLESSALCKCFIKLGPEQLAGIAAAGEGKTAGSATFDSRGRDKAVRGAQHRPGEGLGDLPTLLWEMLVVSPPHQVWNNHLHVGDAGRGWNGHLRGAGDVGGLCLLAQCPRAQGFGSPGIWSSVMAVILPVLPG